MTRWSDRWEQAKRFVLIRSRFYRRKFWSRRDVLIFLFCVGIAALFWLLDALSYQYDSSLSLPIQYRNIPQKKQLMNELPEHMYVHVNATGKDIIFLHLSSLFQSIRLNVAPHLRYKKDTTKAFVLLESQVLDIERQFPSEMRIQDIQPDTIHFQFENIVQRQLPVRLKAEITFQGQHGLMDSIEIHPDSVMIQGPGSFIDTLDEWPTQQAQFSQLSSPVQQIVPLQSPPDPNVSLSPRKVNVHIPVVTFTEGEQHIPITLQNTPDSFQVIITSQEVKVTYQVALQHYKEVNKSLFQVTADFQDFPIKKKRKVPLSLSQAPDFIRNVRITPQEVEFIVTPVGESTTK